MKLVCAALTALVPLTAAMAHAADQRTTALLHQALDAQGGEEKLRALKSVQWEAAGYRSIVEQSERPEGPTLRSCSRPLKFTISSTTAITAIRNLPFTRHGTYFPHISNGISGEFPGRVLSLSGASAPLVNLHVHISFSLAFPDNP